ncbi:hypothetical protein [Marinimicrobium sp. ABcell2]|uniref:hypothetical protein n=1 Tax=Marinimicrobium sp. ABcell2 TaxID=3069751 RepID=UPI0027AE117A|nr:hypothetical protein [Marinimicrobium sp. ABcell2]MDQ2076200.1 hypothetical protein [Marinimicrobium sp. ABcell2]
MRLLFMLGTGVIAVLLYPLAVLLVIAADTMVGDAEFARQLALQAWHQWARVILADWFAALLVALPLWFLIRGLARLGWTRTSIAVPVGLGALLTVLAFMPPYLPLIFGAMLLWAGVLNALFNCMYRRVNG